MQPIDWRPNEATCHPLSGRLKNLQLNRIVSKLRKLTSQSWRQAGEHTL